MTSKKPKQRTRNQFTILAKSKETDEVYKKVFYKYMEVEKWAEKHNMEVFKVDIKKVKVED